MKKFNLLVILMLCVFCSCNKTTIIKPSKTSLTYPIQGGEMLDTIHADGEWEVVSSPDWMKIEKQDSVLKCVVEENKSGKKRDGKITLKGGDIEQTIAVSQAYICTRLNAKETNLTFEKEGGTQTVDIDTDGSEIKVDVSGNLTAKYKDGKLVVDAPANNATTSSGKIVLSCDTVTTQIDVILKGAICPKCGGKGKLTCTKCGGTGYDFKEDDDSAYGCTKCGGSGNGYPPGYCDACPPGNLKKGSGQMPCPVCNGKGS